ncbi:sugar-transfer associated ATP-grasp domain-containing protein [Thioalkalivibrio sp. ALE12]|uniref:sugar-transfer associated ATP-grasp domain-containing protein n=1 Tax=Thioalkalivibrio sp. ALE12 TaxID=1158170 RepID=UPI0009D9175D|nr:sugar-transfer associated ATP-grasp domain-containing protein [Thioalkalivibrio sp. ALE12]
MAGWKTVLKAPLIIGTSVSYRISHICRHFLRVEIWGRFLRAAQAYGISVPVVALRALRWYAADRFLPGEALSRGLLHPAERVQTAGDHISEERLHALQHAVNSPSAAMCRDKLLFHSHCSAHYLPVPQLLAVLSRHGSRDAGGGAVITPEQWHSLVKEQLPESFIAKPRHGRQGCDVRLLGVAHTVRTDASPTEQVVHALKELSETNDEQILEGRLDVHERVATLTGTRALSTVRVFSWVTREGKPEILDAYFRAIVGDRLTDNVTDFRTGLYTGNIVASPELQSGILSRAWAYNSNGIGYRWVDRHPGTRALIVGFPLPWWQETRALVSRAALCFMPIRTIGWDVALTPKGPVLIEANERFQHAGFGEGARRIRSVLNEETQRLRGAD